MHTYIRLLLIFFGALLARATTTTTTAGAFLLDDVDKDCRSNQTHIAWRRQSNRNNDDDDDDDESSIQQQLRHLSSSHSLHQASSASSCHWQTLSEARQESYRYLRANVMKFDLAFLETMGFGDNDDTNNNTENDDGNRRSNLRLPDGLSDGMIGKTIDLALLTKVEFPHADQLPLDIWQEYVLNYAITNEARSNWRPLLWSKLRWLVVSAPDTDTVTEQQDTDVVSRTVHTINANMWTLLAPGAAADADGGTDYIYFKGGSTPIVFDPMSVLIYGYGSCTGTSILLCNALRTVGIPARIAGTAAWGQDRNNGNHNWVEVWKDGKWYFLEPSPQSAASSRSNPDSVDDLERSPCKRWFCSAERFGRDLNETTVTLVYAARLTASSSPTYYPVAWEWNNRDVPGEDVTEYYKEHCGNCQS